MIQINHHLASAEALLLKKEERVKYKSLGAVNSNTQIKPHPPPSPERGRSSLSFQERVGVRLSSSTRGYSPSKTIHHILSQYVFAILVRTCLR